MANKPKESKGAKRDRRGVGAIVGGIILMTILLTSVLIYYVGILSADKVKESYNVLSAQASQDKAAEILDASRFVFSNVTNTYLRTNMTNNGPITLNVTYALLYCADGPTCPADPQTQKTSLVLNPGANASTVMGPLTDGFTYRMDLITERGNIIATTECIVDFGQNLCRNDSGYISPDFAIS